MGTLAKLLLEDAGELPSLSLDVFAAGAGGAGESDVSPWSITTNDSEILSLLPLFDGSEMLLLLSSLIFGEVLCVGELFKGALFAAALKDDAADDSEILSLLPLFDGSDMLVLCVGELFKEWSKNNALF